MISRRRSEDGSDPTSAETRARRAWLDLCDSSMLRRGGGQLLVMDGPGDRAGICPLRTLAQVLVARLDLDRLGPAAPSSPSLDDLADTLELYRWGDGYAEYPGTDSVSGDDNAVIAMAALQAHRQLVPPAADSIWLHRAKRTFEVVTPSPRRADLAGRLFLLTGIERFANVADVADVANTSEPVARSGAGGQDSATGWGGVDDELWLRAPADNASLFSDLLRVDAAEPRPRVLAELDRYLERVWREGRDTATGQFVAGGIGRTPDLGGTLDHAAIVQLFALQARPPEA